MHGQVQVPLRSNQTVRSRLKPQLRKLDGGNPCFQENVEDLIVKEVEELRSYGFVSDSEGSEGKPS